MSSWNSIRYRTKLFMLFLLLSSIPTILIGTTGYQKSSEMLQIQTEKDLKVILAQLNASIERQINDFDRFSILPYFVPEIFSFLDRPYNKDHLGSEDLIAQKTMARMMSAYPSINSSIHGLMIYGMNGSINGYRLDDDTLLNLNVNVKDDQWYKDVLAKEGGFVVTGIQDIEQFAGPSFKAIIASRVLMDDDHNPLAVIAIYVSPSFIPKIVRSLELNDVQITVLDSENHLMYTSEPMLAEQQRSIVQDPLKGRWETEVVTNAGKKNYSGAFLESDYLNWKIYMGVDRNHFLQASRSIRDYTIAIVIAVAFLAAIVSWMLARGLSEPIIRLIRSMREVELGNFSVIPVSNRRKDEIGQLEKNYGRMVQRLGDLIRSIGEKERQKRNAEISALRARIQPHFLYNTLNSIRMLAILQQSNHIAKLLQSLNKLLVANMKLDVEIVTLQDEIQLLKDYAKLMDLRYTNVFEVEWRIPEQTYHATVPPMLLQPLIENAIFHGSKGLNRKLSIVVEASIKNRGHNLVIEVRDNGVGFPEHVHDGLNQSNIGSKSNHIGLGNVQNRIRLHFGEKYGMALKRIDGQTVIHLVMPFQLMVKEEAANVESVGG